MSVMSNVHLNPTPVLGALGLHLHPEVQQGPHLPTGIPPSPCGPIPLPTHPPTSGTLIPLAHGNLTNLRLTHHVLNRPNT